MFDKLKGLFVEVEEDKKPVVADEPAPVSSPKPLAATAVPIVPSSVNEEMAKVLNAAIEAANLDGFDYIEFKNALASLASAPIPEPQKYQTVFATAGTMGLTKQKLIDAIDYYQKVIDKKKEEFQTQVQAMVAKEITSREELKVQKEKEIVDLQEKIRQAQSTISERQQEILGISTEINEQNLRIQQTASAFEATFASVAGKLQEDKAKIQTYIA